MDSQRFDALTRRFGAAGSRRRVLSALASGALGQILSIPRAEEAAAACKGYNGKCKSSASCCPDAGLRCVKRGKKGKGKDKKRCRCRPGWAHCPGAGDACLHVAEDTENCGSCGNQCPQETPCCFGGKCQELCYGECCADCFVEVLENGTQSAFCCLADGGTICGPNKKKKSDDRCCYPTEGCVNGKCCCNDCQGSKICGGKCCAIAACCNGKCCQSGKVCATTPGGGEACVSANRACDGIQDCFPGEVCHGGVCCSGGRICTDGQGGAVCCAAGARCEQPNNVCCPINTSCQSYKGHRVRR